MAEKKGKNSEDIQELNRSLVIQILSKSEVCTRVQISRETGLKQATITKIVAALIEAGVVSEVGIVEGKLGRRSIGLSLNANRFKVIAVKLARKSFQVGLFNLKGENFEITSEKMDSGRGPAFAVRQVKLAVRRFLDQNSDVFAIGMAVPGPYLRSEGRIAIMTEFPGWDHINFNDEFAGAFGVPVYLEHDANAGALAEWRYGDHHLDQGVLVHFLASEGIGAGIVSNGKIFTGSRGVAGEIGHMSINAMGEKCTCGNYGCLELYCSSLAFLKRVNEQLKKNPDSSLNRRDPVTPDAVFEEMKQGDAFCTEMVREVGRYMGYGLANLVNLYDPSVIVISDIMSRGGEVLLEEIKKTVKARVLPVLYQKLTLAFSQFAIDPILYGAAALATEKLLRKSYLICNTNTPPPGDSTKPEQAAP